MSAPTEFDRLRCKLANKLDDMANFLKESCHRIEEGPAMPPERLNLALFLQVHTSAVLEANTAYECAIREMLVNQQQDIARGMG